MEFQHFQVLICLYTKAKRIIDLIFVTDPQIVNHHEKKHEKPMEFQHFHVLICLYINAKCIIESMSGTRWGRGDGGRGDDWLWLVSFPVQTVYYTAGRGLRGPRPIIIP